MGASILAASVQAAFQAWAGEHFPPDRLCSRLNEMVYRRTSPEKFITFFLALYDPESGSVVYTNAGHNPGILVRAGGATELLGAHGPPLGLFPGKTYGSGTFTLETGDLLALYTDGVTEAANPEDEEFGTPRLVETLVKARGELRRRDRGRARRGSPRVHGGHAVRRRPDVRPSEEDLGARRRRGLRLDRLPGVLARRAEACRGASASRSASSA